MSFNSFSPSTLNKIGILFSTLSEAEKDIDISRQILNENFDFDPYIIFKNLDRGNKNKMSIDDLVYFLNFKNIYISKEEANKIISFYDEDKDDNLSYMEFIYLIQSSKHVLNVNGNLYNQYYENKKMSQSIEYGFVQLLDKELSLVRRLFSLINEIKEQGDYDIEKLFNLMKSCNNIISEGIDKFYSEILQKPINRQSNFIRNIIKRIDINNDGRIDLNEFKNFFNTYKTSNIEELNLKRNNFEINNNINNLKANNNLNNNVSDFVLDNKLNDFITECMYIEEKIENAKIDLALRHDFNIENIFRFFDFDYKGYIIITDFERGLNKLSLYPNPLEIKVVFNKYDSNMKNQINFGDLFDMFTPFERDYRIMIENRKPIEGEFMLSTKIYIINLLKEIFSSENKLNYLKRQFVNSKKKIREIFAEIDRDNKGYFDIEDWTIFLKRKSKLNGVINDNQKGRYLVFIRLDKKRRGRVDYCDLMDEFNPID